MKLLKLEFYKCRGRGIGWVTLALLAAQLVWVLFGMRNYTAQELLDGWKILCYDLALLDAITLPAAVAAIASRGSELEHKGAALKLLETLTTPAHLYDAKLSWGAVQLSILLLARLAMFTLFGLAKRFGGPPPLARLLFMTLTSLGVAFVLYILQQSLSLLYKNQAVALVLGIFGSFVGLLSMFFPTWVQRLNPWSYFAVLSQARMDWDPATRATDFYWVSPQPLNFALLGLWLLAFLAVGRSLFIKREV